MGPFKSHDTAADRYLKALSLELQVLPAREREEILRELASHLADCADPQAALQRLGPPARLARAYLPTSLRSPALTAVPHGAVWRAVPRVVLAGIAAFIGGAWLLAALIKPFRWQTTGLWQLAPDHYSLRLGLSDAVTGGQELLGIWLIPMGLFIGGALLAAAVRALAPILRIAAGRRGVPVSAGP